MTRKKPKAAKPGDTNEVKLDPQADEGRLKVLGGSDSDDWNNVVADQTVQTLWLKNSDEEEKRKQCQAALAGIIGIAPRDEIEGMMAAQLLAAHHASMECYRRAMIGEQTFDGRRENLNQANKLSRTWATLLDALNKHRGKGQQKVTVEHVHVHAGGQAVVGTIERPGGGDQTKTEEQLYAKQISNAPEPSLWREDAEGYAVPVPRDGECPLPDARGKISGRTDR